MASSKHTFPTEKFGPLFLNLIQKNNKEKVTSWGPEIAGLKMTDKLGRNFKIIAATWSVVSMISECGKFSYQAKFIEVEKDFRF